MKKKIFFLKKFYSFGKTKIFRQAIQGLLSSPRSSSPLLSSLFSHTHGGELSRIIFLLPLLLHLLSLLLIPSCMQWKKFSFVTTRKSYFIVSLSSHHSLLPFSYLFPSPQLSSPFSFANSLRQKFSLTKLLPRTKFLPHGERSFLSFRVIEEVFSSFVTLH